jgi:hypothetical protein
VRATIHDRIGDNGIGKELWQIGHCTIGCADDRFLSEAAVDDGGEALGGFLIHAGDAEVIGDVQAEEEESSHRRCDAILQVCSRKPAKR